MEKEIVYLIWNTERGMWWKRDCRGYIKGRENAGKYTYDNALSICLSADKFTNGVPEDCMLPIEVCSMCLGDGFVNSGQYDDIREVKCPQCR